VVIKFGPFDELVGSRGRMDVLGPAAQKYKSKVVAPRNPKRLKGEQLQLKVVNQYVCITAELHVHNCGDILSTASFFVENDGVFHQTSDFD